MKIRISIIFLLIATLSCSKEKDCPSFEDFGEFNLLPSSFELFQTLQNNKTAVFKDTLGTEFKFTITRSEDYYNWHQKCDIDDNQIINSKDPIVYQASLQTITVLYTLDTVFSIDIDLYVWMPNAYYTASKEELISTFADALSIHMRDPTLNATLSGFVNLRSMSDTIPSYLVRQIASIKIGNQQFKDVYWDDQFKIEGISDYITYFNKEFGLVGITNSANGRYWYLDRIE
ncbi:MAG: hypothetical protein WBP41_19320 [Saprospiraceae bacterium]